MKRSQFGKESQRDVFSVSLALLFSGKRNGNSFQCSKAEEELPHAIQDNAMLSMVMEAFTVVCGPPIGFGRVTAAPVVL